MLLCHRRTDRANYPNVWDLPGGHIEEGESSAGALRRELAEELGIEVEPPASPWEVLRDGDIELSVFLVDSWVGEPSNTAPDEHDELRWVNPEDIATLDTAHRSYSNMIRRAIALRPS